jgi:hypothetical protein
MRIAALVVLALALGGAGCGVETVQIERQPASAFTEPAERSAYDEYEQRCAQGKSLRRLANEAGASNSTPDAIARNFADREPDADVASAVYSGCLDGLERAKLD